MTSALPPLPHPQLTPPPSFFPSYHPTYSFTLSLSFLVPTTVSIAFGSLPYPHFYTPTSISPIPTPPPQLSNLSLPKFPSQSPSLPIPPLVSKPPLLSVAPLSPLNISTKPSSHNIPPTSLSSGQGGSKGSFHIDAKIFSLF